MSVARLALALIAVCVACGDNAEPEPIPTCVEIKCPQAQCRATDPVCYCPRDGEVIPCLLVPVDGGQR